MTRPDYVPDDAEDITDHGAVRNPDDPNDGSPSINREAIIDAANAAGKGGSIYVPSGTFYYGRNSGNSWIRIGGHTAHGISVYGDGPGDSTLAITEHTPEGGIATMFRYEPNEYETDTVTVTYRGLQLDGNSPNLADDVTGIGINVRGGNPGLSLDFERVHLYQITQSGIRQSGSGDSTIDYCTFEHIGIKFENDRWDGRNTSIEHCYIPSPDASNGDLAKITNSEFLLCSGNACDPGGDGQVVIENCYGEGMGTGLAKIKENSVTVENVYARMNTPELENLLASMDRARPYDGRVGIYFFDDSPGEVVLSDVKFQDMTEQASYVDTDISVEIKGDKVAFENVGTKRDIQGGALRERSGAALTWEMDRMSVHGVNSTFDAFDTSTGGGTIRELTWDGAASLGDAGSTTISSQTEGGDPLEPTVPSRDEVGIDGTSGDDGSGEDGEDEDEEDESTTKPPLFNDWTPKWESDHDDWSVVSDSAFAGDTALAFEHSGDTRTRYALALDDIGEPTDVELLDRFRVPAFTDDSRLGFHARAHLRSSEGSGGENGYWIEVEKPTESFRLAKYTDGDATTITRFGTPQEDMFYMRRFRADGDELKAKIWPATEEEPQNWDVETTDSDHVEGWVGVGSFDTGRVETDTFSVATSGETAPRPSTDTSPEVTWQTPDDGGRVSGTVTVQIDAVDPMDADDELDVVYRLAGGSWSSASYNPDTGYYEDTWDAASAGEGEYTLEARASNSEGTTVDAAIEVAVKESFSIATVEARDTSDTSATLVGEVTSLEGVSSVSCGFEWRESGADSWNVTEAQTVSSVDEFSDRITGLDGDTEYQFRAVAYEPDRFDARAQAFYVDSSPDEEVEPVIEQFDVRDRSNPAWNRFDVDWSVSHEDENLDTVVTKLRYKGSTVDAESTSITGETASYSHLMRVRGPVDEVVLSVNDDENRTTTESKLV